MSRRWIGRSGEEELNTLKGKIGKDRKEVVI